MPTYETLTRFNNDLRRLSPEQRRRFRRAVAAFVHDLRDPDGHFHAGLRETREFADSCACFQWNWPRIRTTAPGSRRVPGFFYCSCGR
ncbi:hypothetical protein [Streptomyces yangpuensis]|uniref:hypothetical protein n=1 Tax=Streptomyces yangpuensis TaxID=1648182 RepID=UPI00364CFDAA